MQFGDVYVDCVALCGVHVSGGIVLASLWYRTMCLVTETYRNVVLSATYVCACRFHDSKRHQKARELVEIYPVHVHLEAR